VRFDILGGCDHFEWVDDPLYDSQVNGDSLAHKQWGVVCRSGKKLEADTRKRWGQKAKQVAEGED